MKQDGKIVEVMKSIKGQITAKLNFPCDIFPGVFDDDAVKMFANGQNRIKLAFLGGSNFDARPSGEEMFNAAFGAYMSTVGTFEGRTFLGINALENVAILLATLGEKGGDEWEVRDAMTPVIGALENLYSKDAGKGGFSIFGLSFAVPLIIGESTFALDLKPLKGFITGTSLPAPADEYVYDPTNPERVEQTDDIA